MMTIRWEKIQKRLLPVFFLWACLLPFTAAAPLFEDTYDAAQVNAQLEQFAFLIASNKPAYNDLFSAIQKIAELKKQAANCVSENKAQIIKIDQLLQDSVISKGLSEVDRAQYNDLITTKNNYVQQIAQCSLISFRADELLELSTKKLASITRNTLFERSPALWLNFKWDMFKQISLHPPYLLDRFLFQRLSQTQQMTLLVALLLSLGLSIGLYRVVAQLLIKFKSKSMDLKPILPTLKYNLPLMTVLMVATGYLHVCFPAKTDSLVQMHHWLMSDIFLFVVFAYTVIKIFSIIALQKPKWFSPQLIAKIKLRFTLIVSFILFGGLGTIIFSQQVIPISLLQLVGTSYLTALISLFVWFFWLFFEIKWVKCLSESSLLFSKLIIIGFLGVIILMAWSGYQIFAMFFIPRIIMTIFIMFVFFRLSMGLKQIYRALNDEGRPLAEKLHRLLGLSSKKTLVEIWVIRIIINLALAALTTLGLMWLWGVPKYYIEKYIVAFMQGTYIFNIRIIPLRIMRGGVMFCTIIILGRWISTSVARHASAAERDRQVTISTLISYITFVIALLIGITIAGYNLMNLALIAGALSFGIGFGLQNLAKDFVSGIVMLVNKPVRPGDRIVVDDIEGYVKKIRLLSTQVTTAAQTDVMIPNSYLVSKSIVNYTYGNKFLRINTAIVLTGDQQVELATKLLLEIVARNPNIVQEEPNKPKVLYELSVFNGGLVSILNLSFVIKDVALKQQILSEVNLAAIDILKKNEIAIKL